MSSNIWQTDYKQLSILGSNDYKTVYKAKSIKSKKLVSIKEFSINSDKEMLIYERELNYMNQFQSENTVKILDTKNTKDNMYIISDYSLGNLEDFIKIKNNHLSPGDIQSILSQLNKVFKMIREKKIIHRNIKPSNIFFSNANLNTFIFKLDGMNLCIKEGDTDELKLRSFNLITPPETLKGENPNETFDIWSIGILIYYMLFGEYPYEGKRDMMIIKQIESDKKIKKCEDKELQDLMSKMLKKNVNERISWNEYFNHPFFKKIFEIHQEKNAQENNIASSDIKTNQVLFKEVQGMLEISRNYYNIYSKNVPNNENEFKNFINDLKYIINYYEKIFKKE